MRHFASFLCTHPLSRHTHPHTHALPLPPESYSLKQIPLTNFASWSWHPTLTIEKSRNFFLRPSPSKNKNKTHTLTLDVNTPNRFYNVFSHIAVPVAFDVRNCLSGSACKISVTTAFVTSCSRIALLLFRTHRFRLYLGVTSSWERRGSFPDQKKNLVVFEIQRIHTRPA